MKLIIDNQILKMFALNPSEIVKHPLISDLNHQIVFKWPLLLHFLGEGAIFSTLPKFDQKNPLFVAAVATLHANEEKEVLFHIYDHLFVENLNQIRALPQIQPSFLIEAIDKELKKQSLFSSILTAYQRLLIEDAANTMHDLILYLAWDRMCVSIGRLFSHPSEEPKFIKNLTLLKECLLESYHHITQQGRTKPGIYRMLEAFFFYEMREENLQRHTPSEWGMFTQSFSILKGEDELVDFFYIDDISVSEEGLECYLTLDTPDRVNSRFLLAEHMINKLKKEFPDYPYVLHPKKIIHIGKL